MTVTTLVNFNASTLAVNDTGQIYFDYGQKKMLWDLISAYVNIEIQDYRTEMSYIGTKLVRERLI